jgi:hypothetical protein
MQSNCPICNKAGLPNFREMPTVCPQCNTDLSVFMFLNTISKNDISKKNKLNNFNFSFIPIFFLIIAFILFLENYNYKSKLLGLKTENDKLVFQNKFLSEVNTNFKNEFILNYKVKQGDCLSKIAEYFYDDAKMYKCIEIENNLIYPYKLRIGQIVKIKILK